MYKNFAVSVIKSSELWKFGVVSSRAAYEPSPGITIFFFLWRIDSRVVLDF